MVQVKVISRGGGGLVIYTPRAKLGVRRLCRH